MLSETHSNKLELNISQDFAKAVQTIQKALFFLSSVLKNLKVVFIWRLKKVNESHFRTFSPY